METPDRQRHIEALRELWLTEGDLTFLETLTPDALSRLLAEVEAHQRRVAEGQRKLYEIMARATRFIPNFMVVKLGSGLSAYVQARICEHLEPKAAAALSKSYDPTTLAEISLHLDAVRTAAIAQHTEIDALEKITELLAQRGLYRRLGEISDLLDAGVLEKLVQRIPEPERIAKVAAHMTAHHKLAAVARRLDAQKRSRVVALLERDGELRAVRAITG